MTVPLRRRKVCLMGTFALFAACALVLLIPHPAYAGVIGDFLDIPNMIKTWLLQIAATLFNTYFGVINQTLDARFISGPFNELFGTTEPYGVIKDFYQAGVIPVAHAVLGLFMLMQLIKISQRIDATSPLPAVKDIVFLVVTYCILSYFIDNALDLVSAIYGIFNDLVGNVSDKLQSKNWYEPGIKMTKDDAADATFGGCFLLLIFGLISWVVGLVFYAVSMVVALCLSRLLSDSHFPSRLRGDEANRNRLPQELCGSSPRWRGHGSHPLPLPASCDRPRGFRRTWKG